MAQLSGLLIHILQLAIWLVILVVVFVPLERFFAVSAHKALRKGFGTDLCYYFVNSIVPAAILSLPVSLLAVLVRDLLPAGSLHWSSVLPFWAQAALGFVVGEIGYYWGHRWSHQIPFLWRFHSIHHSAEEMDFLVNTRAHPLDMVFSRFCGIVPLFVLGLSGTSSAAGAIKLPALLMIVGTVWGYFIHSNLRCTLGPLEWLVSSPKFHHWHHTKTGAIDHNYSSTLPWLDRLFGTHNLPKEWPEEYGIEARLPDTLLGQLQYPIMADEREPTVEDAVIEQPAVTLRAND